MAKVLEIEGREWRVVEDLGFQGGVFAQAVVPADSDPPQERRVAVRPRGDAAWRFWTVEDRLR